MAITPAEPAKEFDDADFSPEALQKREEHGHAQTLAALAAEPQDPCSVVRALTSVLGTADL